MSRIQVRRDEAATWTAYNRVLAAGEWGYETDTGKVKIGDGSSDWNSLGYIGGGGGSPTGSAGGALDGSYPNPGLASSVAGAGLAESSDVLSVNVDNSTIEISSDTLRVKDGGITEAKQTLADVTTWDVSTSRHGYVPKAPNDTSKFLRGDATWAAPGGGGGGTNVASDTIWDTKGDLAVGTGADAATKLVVGADGSVLVADSAQTAGVKWAGAVVTATSVSGLGTPLDGQAGQLRLGSSPYHFVPLIYDGTRSKWVTPQLLTNFSVKDSAITSTATSYGVFSDTEVTRTFIPFMKAMYDAGLSPEVCLVSQMFNSSGANTNFMQAAFYDFDDGDTAITQIGTGGEISNTSSTAGAPKYTTDGWEAVSITPTQTHGVMLLQRKVSAGTGTFSVPQAWLRWVG